MNLSYIKLDAKDRLVNSHAKCFFVSLIPYTAIIFLSALNYYLYILLEGSNFTGSYSSYLKPTLLTLCIILSFILYCVSKLCADRYFFVKSRNPACTLRSALKSLKLRQCITAGMVLVLKFFLSVAWSAVYLLPSAAVAFTLLYCLQSGEYGRNLLITLALSAVTLFLTGTVFLYITLKRYSMTEAVIFSEREKDSLRVIAKSIELMEGNTVKYAAYCLSFMGWVLSCLLIFPVIYVLPYKNMAKYSFYDSVTSPRSENEIPPKPIVFRFPEKARTE
ncbi:MAG: DUF975 family protein [Oscillospiraceae bacterium]|nr:DUF975 family protein [Oscillospiraceae bacterium]